MLKITRQVSGRTGIGRKPGPARSSGLSATSSCLLKTVKGSVILSVKQPPGFLSRTHSSPVPAPQFMGNPTLQHQMSPCPVVSWGWAQGSGGQSRAVTPTRPGGCPGALKPGPWDRSGCCQATTSRRSAGASPAQRGNEEMKRHGEVGTASDPRRSCSWRNSCPRFFLVSWVSKFLSC